MRRNRREIIVELTPLLDVILIMLFVIMSYNSQTLETEREKAENEISTIQQEYSEREDDLKNSLYESEKNKAYAESKLQGYEVFDEYSLIISIEVVKSESEQRCIVISAGDENNSIDYDWSSLKYAENSLSYIIENYIEKSDEKPVFIVFNFKSDEIYFRDYQIISTVIDSLDGQNIYIKYNEL